VFIAVSYGFFAASHYAYDLHLNGERLMPLITKDNLFMIIPTWFSDKIERDDVKGMLEKNLSGSERFVHPQHNYVYLDGIPYLDTFIQREVERIAPGSVVYAAQENLGKGKGVEVGLKEGLEKKAVEWLCVRDADGDHRLEDLYGMLELANQMQEELGDVPVCVVGGRYALEPPLTMYRAVYEVILNECFDAAVKYALARRQQAVNSIYYRQYRRVPDLQSGYKLFNRKAAQIAVDGFAANKDELDVYKLGAEVIPYFEIVLNGGVVGERLRSTYREQPTSAYASIKRAEFYAAKMGWAFRRCKVSVENAAKILDAELIHCPLIFDGMGRAELMPFRKLTLEAVNKESKGMIPPFRQGAEVL
jgi:hypothetical protein